MDISSVACAQMDVANELFDQLLCNSYHKQLLKKFSQDDPNEELVLPSVLHRLPNQKDFLNRLSDNMGLSMQPTDNSKILLTKKLDPDKSRFHFLELAPSSIALLTEDVEISSAEICSKSSTPMVSVRSNQSCPAILTSTSCSVTNKNIGCLPHFDKPPMVPCLGANPAFMQHRLSLPIYQHRLEILEKISTQKVTTITGDGGCGKTTQVPQYILENAHENKTPCRIVCVLPRRLSVLTAQDRVTAERGLLGEKIVGYQIGLESRGTNCPLTFCTTQVFMRTLIHDEESLSLATHLIIDQVHERDRYTDVLLGVIKIRLAQNPHLHLILLSTNITSATELANYFDEDKIIIKSPPPLLAMEFFLEDILVFTNFLAKKNLLYAVGSGATDWEPSFLTECDNLIMLAWFKGSDIAFQRLMKMVREGRMSIDYQHSQTGITVLMAASIHNNVDVVKAAFSSGANPTIKVKGYTLYDLVNEFARPEIADLLYSYGEDFARETGCNIVSSRENADVLNEPQESTKKPEDVVKCYYAKYNPCHVNLELVVEVISWSIDYSQSGGTILVYLPTYSDVIELREIISANSSSLKGKIEVHALHGHMLLKEFKKLHLPAAPGRRKIVFTTSIAESGLMSIDDINCIIDSGLICSEESSDTVIKTPRTQWIGKGSAYQRSSHLRHGGIIFKLYTRLQFNGFNDFPTPKIMIDPISDVCLFAGALIPEEMNLSHFFWSLPDSPITAAFKEAVSVLSAVSAIDAQQKITEFGLRLIDLPVEPRIGKMIVVGVALKCLDPVLTIACSLTVGDPFIAAASLDERRNLLHRKYEMSADYYSDHMVLLEAFQLWEKATDEKSKRLVCAENYLSVAKMQLISHLRVAVLAQLRSVGIIEESGQTDLHDHNVNSEIWTAVKAAILAGLYPNLAHYSPTNGNVILADEIRSQFHYNSTLLAQESRNNGFGVFATVDPQSFESRFHSMKLSTKLPCAPLRNPWVMFNEKQHSGQFDILSCCSVVTPLTALLFAGQSASALQILKLDPKEELELVNYWNEDIEHSDDFDEEELIRTCQELGFENLSQDVISHNRAIKAIKKSNHPQKNFVILKLDDFVGFIIDEIVAQLIVACRTKFQTILSKRIRDPGYLPPSENDESILRSVLSVLASEETAMAMLQPSSVGRKPETYAKNKVVPSIQVLKHATPAVELHPSIFPTNQDFNQFHRPQLQRYTNGPLSTSVPHAVHPLLRHIQNVTRQRELERNNADEDDVFFMRKPEDLSGKDGGLIMLEYSEEHPSLLSQVGMASRVTNYYNPSYRDDEDSVPPQYKHGETVVTHSSPFLGSIHPGQSIQSFENNMYRAPIYEHTPPSSDFLVIRSKSVYSIREVDSLFTVGQECPIHEVPRPKTVGARLIENSLIRLATYREFWKNSDTPRRIHKLAVVQQFPDSETTVHQILKACANFVARGQWWVLKLDFNLPPEEELRALVSPEQCCAYFSMRAGQLRLKNAGYDEKDYASLDGEPAAAPWNTTHSYLLAKKGEIALDVGAHADPTGSGEGIAYTPLKQQSKQAPSKKSAVSGTNADLRKLNSTHAKALLLNSGYTKEEVRDMPHRKVISILQKLPTAGKFSRPQHISDSSTRQDEIQWLFDLQHQVLSSAQILTSDEDESQEENPEWEAAANSLEYLVENKLSHKEMLFQKKKRELEDEEEERKKLVVEMMGPEVNRQPPQPPSSNVKVLRIVRTLKDGTEEIEVVRDKATIEAYLRAKADQTKKEKKCGECGQLGHIRTSQKCPNRKKDESIITKETAGDSTVGPMNLSSTSESSSSSTSSSSLFSSSTTSSAESSEISSSSSVSDSTEFNELQQSFSPSSSNAKSDQFDVLDDLQVSSSSSDATSNSLLNDLNVSSSLSNSSGKELDLSSSSSSL